MYLLLNDNTINKVYTIALFTHTHTHTHTHKSVSIEQIQNIVIFPTIWKHFQACTNRASKHVDSFIQMYFSVVTPLFDIPCVLGYISIKIVVYKIKK